MKDGGYLQIKVAMFDHGSAFGSRKPNSLHPLVSNTVSRVPMALQTIEHIMHFLLHWTLSQRIVFLLVVTGITFPSKTSKAFTMTKVAPQFYFFSFVQQNHECFVY